MEFTKLDNSSQGALALDNNDPLKSIRSEFHIPKGKNNEECLYFAGHSLGAMPKKTKEFVDYELEDWSKLGVEGHFEARHPWLPYHENITTSFSKLVGARESEVVAMNTLTSNLHLMLVSFYRPTKSKFKILIENNTFPSDKYAVDSQARFHGFDPNEVVVELKPREGEMTIRDEDLKEQIDTLGDSLALIMLGNCNYLSGQCFDMQEITKLGHKFNAFVGFNLAHGAGNLELLLHDWNVDFAVWCSYKYLNSGPGGLAGCFIHENHLGKKDIPRFEGWWGTNKSDRFKMGPDFDPIPTAEAWQLSNPPILPLAALRSSMEIFDRVGMKAIVKKRNHLTSYLEWLLKESCEEFVRIQTPSFDKKTQRRGAMLSIRVSLDPKKLVETFKQKDVIVDFREPDILRIGAAPLYNSYTDVFKLVQTIKEIAENG